MCTTPAAPGGAWSGSTAAIKNMKKRGSSFNKLPESNCIKQFLSRINNVLKPLMAPSGGADSGKTHVLPAELDHIVSTFSIEPPPTVKEMSQLYQYYRGNGLKSLRRGAGDLRLRITAVNKDLVQNMVIARKGAQLSNPMTGDQVSQLYAATLQALNKHEKTSDTDLSDDMKKAVFEWAHDTLSGQGSRMLSTKLTA
jgi:hypothetical protein